MVEAGFRGVAGEQGGGITVAGPEAYGGRLVLPMLYSQKQ